VRLRFVVMASLGKGIYGGRLRRWIGQKFAVVTGGPSPVGHRKLARTEAIAGRQGLRPPRVTGLTGESAGARH